MEPELPTTGHMTFVDNRCACCPYGYHIDIDFLRYLDSLGKGPTGPDRVSQLRRSMEVFLRRKELEDAGGGGGDLPGREEDLDVDLRQLYDYDQSLLEHHNEYSRYQQYVELTIGLWKLMD